MKNGNPYKEANRYIENAKITLNLARKSGKFYIDDKYVRSACGIAYLGALRALDFLFDFKKVPKKKGRKSIQYYQGTLAKIDKRLLDHLQTAYHVLHLEGYYDGEKKIGVIDEGFDSAISIINALKPYSKNGKK